MADTETTTLADADVVRERPRAQVTRNAVILAAGLVLLAVLITATSTGISHATSCSTQFARLAAAELRFRADEGRFGTVPELLGGGQLTDAPDDLIVTLVGSTDPAVRVRGTGDCDGFSFTQDNTILPQR